MSLPVKHSPEIVQFIENMGLYYEAYSIPRIGGRIFGLLLVSGEPLLAEDIAQQLGVARSSVSTNVRLLVTAGLVSRTSRPGDRRDFYSIPDSAWSRSIEGRIHSTQALQPVLQQGLQATANEEFVQQRLQKMLQWNEFLVRVYQQALREWEAARTD